MRQIALEREISFRYWTQIKYRSFISALISFLAVSMIFSPPLKCHQLFIYSHIREQSLSITKPSVLAECWCLPCVKSMGNSNCLFFSLREIVTVSQSCVISSRYFWMPPLCSVVVVLVVGGREWRRIRNSGNKVERGLKVGTMNAGAQARLPVGLRCQ